MRTLQEVADIMTARGFRMSANAVWNTERRALDKLRVTLLGGVTQSDRRRRRIQRCMKVR